jgi:L-ascorbate metabolism protein UlaG (beta-lactamase superfamily)
MHPFEDLIVPEDAVGIHWFGQASFALKDPVGTILQVDPYYPRERPPAAFIHPRPPLDEATLRTDVVLVTHNHADHTCLESLHRIHAAYPETRYIGPPESSEAMKTSGLPIDRIITVTAGDTVSIDGVTVHAVWAKPPDGIPEDGIPPPDVQHLGYVVEVGSVRIYVSGDPVSTFADHEFLLKPIRDLHPDIGLLTTSQYGGEFPSSEGCAKMAVELGLKAVVPAHYGCFVGTLFDPEEWISHLPRGGPQPLIIPYNQSIVYHKER